MTVVKAESATSYIHQPRISRRVTGRALARSVVAAMLGSEVRSFGFWSSSAFGASTRHCSLLQVNFQKTSCEMLFHRRDAEKAEVAQSFLLFSALPLCALRLCGEEVLTTCLLILH